MASVGCVMERSFEIFVFSKILGGVVVGPGFRVGGWRQEMTSRIMSFPWEFRRQQVGHGWPDVEDCLTEPCFLGGFVVYMRHRIMSEVMVSGTWTDCGVVVEAIGPPCESCPRRGCGSDVVTRCEQGRRPSRKEMSWVLLPTKLQPWGPGVIQGRSSPLGGLFHQSLQSVSAAQVGQVALSVCRAIWPLILWRNCVSAADTSGRACHGSAPKAVVESGCAAAGVQDSRQGVDNGVSDAESDLLDGDLCAEKVPE